MNTAKKFLVHPDAANDSSCPDDMRQIDVNPPMVLLAGLIHEAARRIACKERVPTSLLHTPSAEEVEKLCIALMSNGEGESAEDILGKLAENTTKEVIYLHYLAAAARRLGDWWTEDRASFAEVTVATGWILELLRKMTIVTHPASFPWEPPVIFASVPGEQHTLGIRMAADLFRSDGWEIALKIGLSQEELVAEIKMLQRCIVGLSIGGRHSLDKLSGLVEALHAHCPRAVIVVSGQDIEDIRQDLSAMGLDGIASGLTEAKEHISALWDREMARKAFAVAGEGKPRIHRS